MDTFSYRFFAPAGMMVSIGIFGLIKNEFIDSLKKFQIIICLFLFILCGGIVQKLKCCTIETSAYQIFYNQALESVASIPSKGTILNYDGDDAQLMAFRPDIMVEQVLYDDTVEAILLRYNDSTGIYIQKGVLNTIVNDKNYSDESRNTFSQYLTEEANEEDYIQIYEK